MAAALSPGSVAIRIAVLVGGLLGALLLLVAEGTTLYAVYTAGGAAPVESVNTGSHQGYALVPIALLAALLSGVTWLTRGRAALLALAVLGLIALLIAGLGDLPDAHAKGLVRTAATQFVNAAARPSAGLYIETLGGAVLLLASGLGLLLLRPLTRSQA
jgi:hypothetical protein